ncbi:hypothetical protein [Sulfurovum sp.]|uniref:hypothetical protein n=1 Tax=Sulfurovum sp. TaxID=1969726 RepID=UPI00345DEA1E
MRSKNCANKKAVNTTKISTYICTLCDESVDDVHHIAQQKEANHDGHIDHFHKNHKYNLIPLCKKHHTMVHEGKIVISGFMMTSEGLKLHYEIKE